MFFAILMLCIFLITCLICGISEVILKYRVKKFLKSYEIGLRSFYKELI